MESIDDHVRLIELSSWLTRAAGYRTYVASVDGLVIDTGFARGRKNLLAAMRGLTVNQIVNTHSHEDHSGNNAELAAEFGATLYAPVTALADLADPRRGCRYPYQRVIWGVPTPSFPSPLGTVVRTERFTFEVIPTPGHSPDHVCFYEPEHGWLFGGDLFLSPRVRLARPFENGRDLIASLDRILTLRPRRFFCYHRGLIESPMALLGRKLHALERLQRASEWLSDRGVAPRTLTRRLLGAEPWNYRLVTWGDLSKVNLIRSLLKPRSTITPFGVRAMPAASRP